MAGEKDIVTDPFQERFQFETLLTDLSARFINLPAGQVDAAIEYAQGRICDCLGLDISALWQRREDGAMILTHQRMPLGAPELPPNMDAGDTSPWGLSQIRQGKPIILTNVGDSPPEAAQDRILWRQHQVKSLATLPLGTDGGNPFGALSFVAVRKQRDWSPDLINRLWLVARLFANALARKKVEAQLRESEERLALATAAAGAGLWILDSDRTDFWINDKVVELFGLPPGNKLGKNAFLAMVHPEDRPRVKECLARVLESPDMATVEYRTVRPDGSLRWMLTRGRSSASGPDGTRRLMGLTFDITDRKNADLETARLRSEMAHFTRVSMLGELAASLAHELNQPLAAILSNAQAARRFMAMPDPDLGEIRAILDDIVADDKRAGEVIHRLRTLVQKKNVTSIETVNLNELALDTHHLVNSELISRNIPLELDLAEDLPPVLAGAVELQQILLNLLVNAMDAMRDQPADQRDIRLATRVADGRVRLSVRDKGPGIPEALLNDVFRPFFSTKPQGLGMGLAISRSLIEAFGGRLWAENDPAGGALMQLELPPASPPQP